MINFVPKGWGYEKWLVNNDLYCGKILWFAKGKKCSYHYHKLKTETFYVRTGRVILRAVSEEFSERLGDDGDMSYELGPGDTFDIPPGTRHQIEALEDAEIIEFSTHHEDSDSYRIVKGD